MRYEAVRQDDPVLRERRKELARVRRRFGYRRLHVFLRREGYPRDSFLRNTADPSQRPPCSWKTRFARSMPMMATSDIDALSSGDGFNTHHTGTMRCRQKGHPRHQQSRYCLL